MRENSHMQNAKDAKNDEFYTQYSDIQKELNAYLEYNPDSLLEEQLRKEEETSHLKADDLDLRDYELEYRGNEWFDRHDKNDLKPSRFRI